MGFKTVSPFFNINIMDEEKIIILAPSGKKYDYSELSDLGNKHLYEYSDYLKQYNIDPQVFINDFRKVMNSFKDGSIKLVDGGLTWSGDNKGPINPGTVRYIQELLPSLTPVVDVVTPKKNYSRDLYGQMLNLHFGFSTPEDYTKWSNGGVYGSSQGQELAKFTREKFIPTLDQYDYTDSQFKDAAEAKKVWESIANSLETERSNDGLNVGSLGESDTELLRQYAGNEIAKFITYIRGVKPKSQYQINRDNSIKEYMDTYGLDAKQAAAMVDEDYKIKLKAKQAERNKALFIQKVQDHINNTWVSSIDDPFQVVVNTNNIFDLKSLSDQQKKQLSNILLGIVDSNGERRITSDDSLKQVNIPNALSALLKNAEESIISNKQTDVFTKVNNGLYIVRKSINPIDGTAHAYDPNQHKMIKIAVKNYAGEEDIEKLFKDALIKYLRRIDGTIYAKRGQKMKDLRKFDGGGEIDEFLSNIDKYNQEKLIEEADALNIEPKRLEIRKAPAGNLRGDTWYENLRAGSTALDVASALGSFIPVAGPFIGGIGGTIATTGNLIADTFDPQVTWGELAQNLGINAALTGASVFTGLGAAKLAKLGKAGKAVKYLRGAGTAFRHGMPIIGGGIVLANHERIGELYQKWKKGELSNSEARELLTYMQMASGTTQGLSSNYMPYFWRKMGVAPKHLTPFSSNKTETYSGEPGTYAKIGEKELNVGNRIGRFGPDFANDTNTGYGVKTILRDIAEGNDNLLDNGALNLNIQQGTHQINVKLDADAVSKLRNAANHEAEINKLMDSWGILDPLRHKITTKYTTIGKDDFLDHSGNLKRIEQMYGEDGKLNILDKYNHSLPRTKKGFITGVLRRLFPNDPSSDDQLESLFNTAHQAHGKDLSWVNFLQKIRQTLDNTKDIDDFDNLIYHMNESPGSLKLGGTLNPLKELRKNFTLDNSYVSDELSKFKSGGIIKANTGTQIPDDRSWFTKDLLEALPGWTPELDNSQSNGLKDNSNHGHAGNLDFVYKRNQDYTSKSNKTNITSDINSAYKYFKSQNPDTTNDEFIEWYNNQIDLINNRFKQGSDIYNGGSGAREGNKAHNLLFSSQYTGDNALGYAEDISDIYGSHSWLRRGDVYKTSYNDLSDEDKELRTHTIAEDNNQFKVIKENDGHISMQTTSNEDDSKSKNAPDENPIYSGDLKQDVDSKNDQNKPIKDDQDNNPILSLFQKSYPNLLNISRYLKNLRNNQHVADLSLQKGINLKSPIQLHRNTYGDFQSLLQSQKLADQIRSKSNDLAEATVNSEVGAAIQLEGELKAQQQEMVGRKQDSDTIKQSSSESQRLAEEMYKYNQAVSEDNMDKITANENRKLDVKAAQSAADTTNYNNWSMGEEQRAITDVANLKEAEKAEKTLKLEEDYKNLVTDTPTIRDYQAKAYAATTNEERLYYLKQIEMERNLNERYYRDYFYKSKLALLRNNGEQTPLPAPRKPVVPNPLKRKPSSKKGGKLDYTKAKIQAEDLKELRKQIRYNITTNQKALDNLSKATLLELKRMMGV